MGFVDCAYSAQDEEPLPEFHRDFIGDWVPKNASCKSALRFRVGPKRVVLVNGQKSRSFKIRTGDYCMSCEGGARYSGQVIWLTPGMSDFADSEYSESSKPSFDIRFNADEKIGTTVLNMEQNPKLAKRFPLDGVELRKCK